MRNIRNKINLSLACILILVFGWGVLSGYGQHPESIKRGTLETPRIYLNLSGFNLEAPKRFTVPSLEDGTSFIIRRKEGGDILYEGKINNQIGDFSAFNPKSYYPQEYVVEAGQLVSEPFFVGPWWLQKVTYQPAMDFMIQSRHYVGNVREVRRKSYGWRDDTHFAFELNALVEQYLSNPAAYTRMPRKVTYNEPDDRAAWGTLLPYDEEAPDIVKLIHWGADVIVTRDLKHEMFKEQLAYFLYAWPWIKQWLPDQNYQVVQDYAFGHWTDPNRDQENQYWHEETPEGSHNLLEINTELGSTKGGNPPGHTIQPNLLMYEVAKRQGKSDPEKFLNAAVRQTAWIIENLDWQNPQTTKGQRTSEHVTLTALVHMLREYPEAAPEGLQQKITEWAEIVISRSDNMWDFRKLSDDQWVPTGSAPTMWNETGNLAGFPAIAYAAASVINNREISSRLEVLAQSHFDNLFGRNPTGRAASYNAPSELTGVEHGWFSEHLGGIGLLENVMFVLDGSPKEEHYPYNPELGDVGWTEGWVNFNTAYNRSLAWHAWYHSGIDLVQRGDKVEVALRAPLNFNYNASEPVELKLTTEAGDTERVRLEEVYNLSREMRGSIYVKEGRKLMPDNGFLELETGEVIKVSYGFGYLQRKDEIVFGR
ncbi:hypothetical protein ACG2F4_09340 [Halalkalibaculum sp. DA3122]|uniref:hypothetical protein n=1 Tax=Halalkalibaculum sp. DA3122 TaxID=3373607 RepID=UPI0037547693